MAEGVHQLDYDVPDLRFGNAKCVSLPGMEKGRCSRIGIEPDKAFRKYMRGDHKGYPMDRSRSFSVGPANAFQSLGFS
jgi:hypothetical protein